jgi:hypothetical protein
LTSLAIPIFWGSAYIETGRGPYEKPLSGDKPSEFHKKYQTEEDCEKRLLDSVCCPYPNLNGITMDVKKCAKLQESLLESS